MKLSPARIALALLFVFIGCFGVAYAAAGMLTALPAPAVGGTCGPSTASETALEALAKPGSIGAGPEPPASNTTAHQQWKTFVQQCQALADRRGLASLAVLVLSVAVAAVGLIWVFRSSRRDDDADETVDGAADWPGTAGPGDLSALVGAGVAIAPPAGTAPGVVPYPAPQAAWAPQPPGYQVPQPPAPHPYAYPAQPGYLPSQGYPAAPQAYPAPAAYPAPPAPPGYPTPAPGYPAPAGEPAPAAHPAPPPEPVSTPSSTAPPESELPPAPPDVHEAPGPDTPPAP